MHRSHFVSFFLVCLLAPNAGRATPKYAPFTYPYETLGEGQVEIEQYADLVPLKARQGVSGAEQGYAATQFQTELEYGITDHLELGLYLTLSPPPTQALVDFAPVLTEGNGIKQRLRLRIAEPDELPLDIGLYGEVVENDHEIELEAKVILQKRIDPLRLMLNAAGEREFYFDGHNEWVFKSSLAASYQVTPSIFPGVEAWMRKEWRDADDAQSTAFNFRPAVYVGPTISLNFGRVWWATGAYFRVTDLDHTLQPGDIYGNVWVRTIVGLDL